VTGIPGRIGGTRGPNGATLDDVVAGLVAVRNEVTAVRLALGPALELITTGIATQNATLTTLLTRLSWLTGTVSPVGPLWGSSLPQFLTSVLGSRANIVFDGRNAIQPQLEELLVNAADALRYSRGLNIPPVAGSDDANIGIRAALYAIRDAVGEDPPGFDSSIFALLRSIDVSSGRTADCCEDNGGGGDPPPPITPPSACSLSTPFVTTTFDLVATFAVSEPQAGLITVWRPEWTDLPSGMANFTVPSGVVPIVTPNQDVTICYAWNSDGSSGTVLPQGWVNVTGVTGLSGAETPNWQSFYSQLDPGTFPSGGEIFPVNTSGLGPGEGEILNFAFYVLGTSMPDLRVAIYSTADFPS